MKFLSQKNLLFILLFLGGSLFFSCEKSSKKSADRLKVISSFSIISDMIQEIGKDSVIVHNLVPIGTDPHEYSPVPEDIKFASEADLFVYNGLNLEGGEQGWFAKLLLAVNADQAKVFSVTEEVKPLYLHHSDDSKEVNPHAFINPKVGIQMAKAIEAALIKSDEKNQEYYRENAGVYLKELEEIEKKYREKLSEIPEEKRVFIASEQAFQYLNAAYDLKEGFIWAVDTEENGSPEQIKRAIHFVRENKPAVLFVESNVDRRPMEIVSKETGVPIYNPAIFSDELGKPGQEADSYLKYLEYNLKHISKGLNK